MEDKKIIELLTILAEDVSAIKGEQQSLRKIIDKLAINQENVIMPRLDLLYEGQTGLSSQFKSCVTSEDFRELKSSVHILSDATKKLNQDMKEAKKDIAGLRKAL